MRLRAKMTFGAALLWLLAAVAAAALALRDHHLRATGSAHQEQAAEPAPTEPIADFEVVSGP